MHNSSPQLPGLWRISPAGVVQQIGGLRWPTGITQGPDGAVWVTESSAGFTGLETWAAMAHISPSGDVREFPLRNSNADPREIVTGPDGNLWFTENNAHRIARLTPAGALNETTLHTQNGPTFIAPGPDRLWVGEKGAKEGADAGIALVSLITRAEASLPKRRRLATRRSIAVKVTSSATGSASVDGRLRTGDARIRSPHPRGS